jgi:polyferredoxin
VQAGGRLAFEREFAPASQTETPVFWRDPGFLLSLLLFLAFFPVYFSGRDGLRLAYQLSALLLLGFGLNTLFTEIDLLNLSQGHVGSWAGNPQRWLLLGFVLLSALLLGPAWCGYVCPFGVVQELMSRLGRRLYLRSYVSHELELRVRYLKYLLLALLLILVWLTADNGWAAFDPMQHLFGGHFGGWIGALLLLSLAGSLVYVRFWCRYFCPVGAFLALFNKLALFNRLGPKRRFDHCDLGVRDEYDVDCIRCQRCLSGRDYGVRHRPR